MKCLIADDEITSRFLLQNMMAEFFSCDTALNGKEAIQAFESAHQEGQPYDLICMDVIMPEIDGHQALKLIREKEQHLHLTSEKQAKVILISALIESEIVKDVLTSEQQNAYLAKPVIRQKLVDQLQIFGLI